MEKSRDAFRTISEVAELLETPAHVLRFWESRFPQVRPVKRAGGRRYYRPTDVALLSGIKRLLHSEGLTIRGVQKVLREHGIRHVMTMADGSIAIDALEEVPSGSDGEANIPVPGAEVLSFSDADAEKAPTDVLVLGPSSATRAEPALTESLPLWPELTEAVIPGTEPSTSGPVPEIVAEQANALLTEQPATGSDGSGESLSTFGWLPAHLRALAPAHVADHHSALTAIAARLHDLRDRLSAAAKGGGR